jgi:ATP-dependent DNA helicase RecQ
MHADSSRYGALELTDAARPLLKGETTLQLRRAAARTRKRKAGGRKSGGDRPAPLQGSEGWLFDALRAMRKQLADEQNVPAYVVFHDATLREIAQRRPRDEGELSTIPGIGAAKLARYGPAVMKVLRDN